MNSERLLYVDESYYDSPYAPRFYTMTGALIDFSLQDSYRRMIRDLEAIARRQPTDRHGYHGIHAKDMTASLEKQADLVSAQKVIVGCDAVRIAVTVRTYVANVRSSEDARQICLADLVTYFQSIGSLGGITLDTRDDLGRTMKSSKAEAGRLSHESGVGLPVRRC